MGSEPKKEIKTAKEMARMERAIWRMGELDIWAWWLAFEGEEKGAEDGRDGSGCEVY